MTLTASFIDRLNARDLSTACEEAVSTYLPHARSELGADELATRAGLHVSRLVNPGFEGRIVWNEQGVPRIEIAAGRPFGRARFTVAHELGHWLIGQVVDKAVGQSTRYRSTQPLDRRSHAEEERLANSIAAEIVIPASRVRDAAKYAVNPTLLRCLAKERRVSMATCLRRFAEVLGVHALSLRAMPMRFSERSSIAEVDSVSVYRPDGACLTDRKKVRFASRVPFCLLGREVWKGLAIILDGEEVIVKGEAKELPGPDPCCEVLCIELVK